jgi:ATP-dependent helicase Lhr and Lhr-like helicase
MKKSTKSNQTNKSEQSAFQRFPLRLQEAIVARVGWSTLRPVQELASHTLLDGHNAIILAPTAGGKTEAAMFPLLAQLVDQEPTSVGVIYIAPIKALLNNQADRLGLYTEMVGLDRFLWHGDITASKKKAFLQNPSAVLMTTPESLEVMLLSPKVPQAELFQDLRAVVIDEVHAIAGTDRGAHLLSVLERLTKLTKNDIQRVGLSATVGNPVDILTWLQGSSQRSGQVVDPPKVAAKRDIKILFRETLGSIASEASTLAQGKKSLFFCQSRALSEDIAERMRQCGTDVFVHHSSVSLEERTMAEDRFQQGQDTCIVCTSTLELGIDVGDLDAVLQANAPTTVSSFLQRLGRTGRRAGGLANTTFFTENTETLLQAIAIVELARQGWVESVQVSDRTWTVLVHQIFALTLQFGGISSADCWTQLSIVPDFAGISQQEFDELIQHMIAADFLFTADGLLSLGNQAEKVFGRRNFMELYAVFSSPQLYQVQTTAGYTIGSLEQTFVDKLVPEISSFLLGGRPWVVSLVNHDDRTVVVSGNAIGKKPSWGGFTPQLLSFELCQAIAKIITSDEQFPYIDRAAQEAIDNYRADLGQQLLNQKQCIEWNGEEATWWTFGGGQINHTLKYGIQRSHDWIVKVDNFKLRIEGDSLGVGTLGKTIKKILTPKFWQEPATISYLMNNMPGYRFSKFQQVLPDAYALEVVQSYLLDVPGVQKIVVK